MTPIPDRPWEVVSVDFGGPYPDGHYNLVVIDKRTRYPEVEMVHSTATSLTKEKLKKIFATYGTPIQLESDNGPPFNSKEFAEFASQEGFKHHRVTPLHPRANGEAENFMKLINKTEQRAHVQRRPIKIAMQEMLTGYRSTPHPATGVSPYVGMMNRQVRTKLDYLPRITPTVDDKAVNERDRQYKEKIKQKATNRNTKEHNFQINDHVLLQQRKRNKWTTDYEPAFYIIYKIDGSTISARRIKDGREVTRDSSQFKLVDINTTPRPPDWRERTLRRSRSNTESEDVTEFADDSPDIQNTPTTDRGAAQQSEPNNISQEQQPIQELDTEGLPRRSQRTRKFPKRFDDYKLY